MAIRRIVEDLNEAGSGPFVLLAGAGVSIWHPSSLPTWGSLVAELLGEAKARARRALPKHSPLYQDIGALTVEDIGDTTFSNALVDMLAGNAYFAVIGALAASRPNDAHRAIARLVRRGVVAAIVTTNFDTLIEQALADEGLPANVYSSVDDYRRPAHPGVSVHKIHGSATEQTDLIDTAGQKLRGLPPVVRGQLCHLFTEYPVIAMGYGGGDLAFGADYLALQAVPPGTHRLWWTVRAEERDRWEPAIESLVSQRGAFVVMTQQAALEALGAGPLVLELNPVSRQERLAAFRAKAGVLFRKLGALNTLAFCMRLLSAAGHGQSAASLWQVVSASVDRRKRQSIASVGPAMRALAAEGNRLAGVVEQERWACRALRDIRRRREGTARRGNEADLVRDVRSEAAACLMIGDARMRRDQPGDRKLVQLASQRAMQCCEYLADITLLPGVFRLYGWHESNILRDGLEKMKPLRQAQDEHVRELMRLEDKALTYLTAAEATALLAGHVDEMESARLRAERLMELGEYDAAALCLERLSKRLIFGRSREISVRIEATLGEIDLRQGSIDRAMARWCACLAGPAFGSPMLDAHVRSTIVHRGPWYSPCWRPTVIAHCDALLGRMASGELPDDGRSDLVLSRDYLEKYRGVLVAYGTTPVEPGFIHYLDRSKTQAEFDRWPAYYVRQDMIDREFRSDTRAVLERLDTLVAEQFVAGFMAKALTAATAHVRRAQRDGTDDEQFGAEVNLKAIRRWHGDPEAERWFVETLSSPSARDPRVRAGLEQRVPHVLWSSNWTAPMAGSRSVLLELDDALALKWMPPPSGFERERAASARFAQDDFVMGRVLALLAVSAYRDEGDPGGMKRAATILRDAGDHDSRPAEDIYHGLCHQMS